MKNITNMVKILGFVATAIGFGAELLHEKEMDAKIEEKVNEALAKREENEDEEES